MKPGKFKSNHHTQFWIYHIANCHFPVSKITLAHCTTCCHMVRAHPASLGLEKCKLICMSEEYMAKGIIDHEGVFYKAPKHSNDGESVSSNKVSFTKDNSKVRVLSLLCQLQTFKPSWHNPALPCSAWPTPSRDLATLTEFSLPCTQPPAVHVTSQASRMEVPTSISTNFSHLCLGDP